MATYRELLTKKTGTFVQSEPHGDGELYTTLLVDRGEMGEECEEALADAFADGGEEILENKDWRVIGFFNVPNDEFNPDDGEAPPQFDAVLFLRKSDGGDGGPIYAVEVDGTAAGAPQVWTDTFEEAGFRPVQ